MSLVRPIIEYPHSILRKVCQSIPDVHHDHVKDVAAALKATAEAHKALGLAAPQIGEDLRMMALILPKSRRIVQNNNPWQFEVVINPKIITESPQTAVGLEGCLSLPTQPILCRRPAKVKVKYQNEDGEFKEEELKGLPANVFQHELDHLNGVLHIDREITYFPNNTEEHELALAFDKMERDLKKWYGIVEEMQDEDWE